MVTVGKTQGMRRCANLLPTVKQEGTFVTESIPYDLKYFLQDVGIIEVLQFVETQGTDQTETYNVWLPSNTDDEPPFQEKKMYRVTVYRNELMIAKFIEDIMSQAIGKARRIGQSGDQVYVHEVIQTSDGHFDEVECTLKTTI